MILTSSPVKRRLQEIAAEKLTKASRPKKQKTKPVTPDDSEEDMDDENIPLTNDSSEYESDTELTEQISEPDIDNLDTGDFVLVRFVTKKLNIIYAGQIVDKSRDVDTNDTLFEVKFLRREKPSAFSFVFPQVEDISEVTLEQIVGKLPMPATQGGTARVARHFIFGVDFSNYEKLLR